MARAGCVMKTNARLSNLVAVMMLVVTVSAEAQQPGNVYRMGLFLAVPPSVVSAWVDAFRKRLRELGYVEGKNIVIETRSAEGRLEQLPILAAEFVSLKVDVIVTGGAQATRASKAATSTIPIVMAQDTDPVGNGFVASLARPGGNITGLSHMNPELAGKRRSCSRKLFPSSRAWPFSGLRPSQAAYNR